MSHGVRYRARSEAALLAEFWEGAKQYDTFVAWEGRTLVVPFLLHRSVACGVQPTVPLMGSRYLSRQQPPWHVDLADECTFYGALAPRPSLAAICAAYGISVAAEAGEDEAGAASFARGPAPDHIERTAATLRATALLYERWLTHLAPPEFLNKLDIR
ncbi:MAG: hypothetical protein GVY29_12490 [Spirochaetes bacterium]|jgi:hypothetical protein|nr:hypothetical protein [Spirochaetota bacterium]